MRALFRNPVANGASDEVVSRDHGGKACMRSRLALLVTAAVIFAPGWHEQGHPTPPQADHLAARMLAPTWEKGAIRRGGPEVEHEVKDRYIERLYPIDPPAALLILALSIGGLALLWLVASHRGPTPHRFCHSKGLSRAPPLRLQLA